MGIILQCSLILNFLIVQSDLKFPYCAVLSVKLELTYSTLQYNNNSAPASSAPEDEDFFHGMHLMSIWISIVAHFNTLLREISK